MGDTCAPRIILWRGGLGGVLKTSKAAAGTVTDLQCAFQDPLGKVLHGSLGTNGFHIRVGELDLGLSWGALAGARVSYFPLQDRYRYRQEPQEPQTASFREPWVQGLSTQSFGIELRLVLGAAKWRRWGPKPPEGWPRIPEGPTRICQRHPLSGLEDQSLSSRHCGVGLVRP